MRGTAEFLRTWEDHVAWLKKWVRKRLDWIDTQDFPGPKVSTVARIPGASVTVDLSCKVGRVYYTLDGSDPRLRGGEPSLASREATNTLTCRFPAVLTARVRSEYNLWSAPLFVHP